MCSRVAKISCEILEKDENTCRCRLCFHSWSYFYRAHQCQHLGCCVLPPSWGLGAPIIEVTKPGAAMMLRKVPDELGFGDSFSSISHSFHTHTFHTKLFASWHMWPRWSERSDSRVLYILRICFFCDVEMGCETLQNWLCTDYVLWEAFQNILSIVLRLWAVMRCAVSQGVFSNEEHPLGWKLHVTVFCLSSIRSRGSSKQHCLLLWISGLGKDKVGNHQISDGNVELPCVKVFISIRYSLETTATSEEKACNFQAEGS